MNTPTYILKNHATEKGHVYMLYHADWRVVAELNLTPEQAEALGLIPVSAYQVHQGRKAQENKLK